MDLLRPIRYFLGMVFTPALPVACLFAVGCEPSDTNVARVYPDLIVTPTSIDFGGTAVLYSSSQAIQLINAGVAVLDVSEIRVESEQGDVFEVDLGAPISLAKDEQTTLNVRFQPETYANYAGSITLISNDEEYPELVIPLVGVGIYAPTPDIALSPPSYDFGEVASGTTVFATIEIANEGDATLTLGNLVQVGSSAFAMVSADPSGYSIPGQQSSTLVYSYTPASVDGDNASLTIPSDDPDEPSVVLPLLGNGGGDFDYPVALIDCPPVIEPRQTVYLDGSGSTDPLGGPLTYQWTMVSLPEGSDAAEVYEPSAEQSYIRPDVGGEYVVQLVVKTLSGINSSPAVCRMDAIPSEDFHVELSWDGGSSDLDLHVLTSGGVFFDSPFDCNFCNQSPSWGPDLEIYDDPSLDIDDQFGYGPENTNIDAPVEDVYRIMVHYFAENGDESVVATIRVYSYGVLVGELSRVMEYAYIWEAGFVNWTDGNGDGVADGTFGVIDDYYDNLVYDADGNPVDANDNGVDDRGPTACF